MTQTRSAHSLLIDESGQGLTEYLVLLILISVASITIVTQLGGAIENRFRAAKEKIQSVSVNPDNEGGGGGNGVKGQVLDALAGAAVKSLRK